MLLKALREEVWRMNMELPKQRLVAGTAGNVSGLDRKKGFVVIKPSGVWYEELKKGELVIVDLEGRKVEGKLRPSVDTPHHIYIYKHIRGINGVVHTHSPWATAFAIAGLEIPSLSTAHADVFGGPVPVSPYVDNRDEKIGQTIIKTMRKGCPVVLLGKHGVFSFEKTPAGALKAAVMVEYVARTSLLAMMLTREKKRKTLFPLSKKEIAKWYYRYHGHGYGPK